MTEAEREALIRRCIEVMDAARRVPGGKGWRGDMHALIDAGLLRDGWRPISEAPENGTEMAWFVPGEGAFIALPQSPPDDATHFCNLPPPPQEDSSNG